MGTAVWARCDARNASFLVHFVFLLTLSDAASSAVGRTPGGFEVSATGTAQYGVPIWTPPAAGGMRPSLAVVYNHTQENGLLGMGIDVAGLSAISRCPKTIAQDGADGPITMTLSDVFCLDGNRLRLTGGTYGVAGSTYQTEFESFVKVTANSAAGNGPAWFQVRHPNGMIYEYGNSADSRIDVGGSTPREWAVSSIRDAAGNRIDFTYHEDLLSGSYRPNAINYATNAAAGVSTAPYQVLFVYESATRPDPIYGYWPAGGTENEINRMERIEVRYSGSPVKIYRFIYESAGGAGGRSRLWKVEECSTSTAECLSPTVLTWTTATAGLQAEQNPSQTTPTPLHLIDVDGDGRQDMVYTSHVTSGSGTWRIRKANASGGFDAEIDTTRNNAGYPSALPLDYDGDGRMDLLVAYASNQWHVLLSTGSGFNAPSNTGITASVGFTNAMDFDGDGRDDLVRMSSSGAATLYVRYKGAGAFGSEVALWSTNNADFSFWQGFPPVSQRYRSSHRRADFNGDGREDFLCWLQEVIQESGDVILHVARCAQGGYDSVDASVNGGSDLGGNHLFGDFNDDGMTDIVWAKVTGGFRLLFGGSTAIVDAASSSGLHTQNSIVADYDGDGRDDVLSQSSSSPFALQYLRGTGTSLAAKVATSYNYANSTAFWAGDVNGDGFTDVVSQSGTALMYRLHEPTFSDLLASATDGFGVAATFTYAPMTDATVYTKGSGAAYPQMDFKGSRPLAKQVSSTDGTGSGTTFTLTFSYEAARKDLSGRGYLGFAKRTIIDSRVGYNLKTEENYLQTWPYTGLPSSIVLKQSSGTVISDTVNSWAALLYSSGFSERKFPYLYSSTTQDRELNGTQFRTVSRVLAGALGVNGIDLTSGMIKDVTTTITEVGSTGVHGTEAKTERVLHTVFNDSTNWCLGRPDRTEVTNDLTISGISPATRVVDRAWNGLYCRVDSVVVEPEVSQWSVTTALGYDSFGNINSQAVTGASMSTRTTQVNWGSAGRFPETITNALSQQTQQGFRYDLGLQSSITDPNNLTTSWTYDDFGRRTLETRPDGTKTSSSLDACPTCDARVRYRFQDLWKRVDNSVIRTTNRYFDQFDRLLYLYKQLPGGAYSIISVNFDSRGRTTRNHNPRWSGGAANGYWATEYDALDRVTAEKLFTAAGALNRSQTHAHNGLAATTTDFESNVSTRYAAAWADLAQVTDAASGATKYKYNPFGQLNEVKDAYNNVTTSVGYNVRGMKVSSTDMDMGFWEYLPNALGEVEKIRDAKTSAPAWTTQHVFDALGRITQRTEAEGATTWTWGTSAASFNIGQLASVAGPGYSESLTYDNKSRLTQRSITTDASYLINFGYHAQTGLLDTLTYPTSTSSYRFKLQYEYAYGALSKVKRFDAPNTEYWKLNTLDARGNVLDELLGNGVQVISGFDPLTGLLETRTAGPSAGTSIQNLDYEWDLNANLWKRKDVRQSNLEEIFSYDPLNRVTGSTLNGSSNLTAAYDLIGNITSKDGSTYTYHATRKHAVTAAAGNTYTYDANGNVATKNGSTISWTSYNYPSSIAGSGVSSQFSYGPDRQRFKQVGNYSGGTETTHYVGGILEKLVTSTRTHFKHYVAGPTGLVATYTRRTDATEDAFYFTKDHLGSVDSVTNQAGTVQVRLSFEAFGKRRKELGWAGAVPAADLTAVANTSRRGYTEHEMLDNLGLIHMNGRVQDPTIGRFLSADPNVPDPTSGQSFNRYSYVRNNPLSAIDPSGFKDTFTIEDNFGNAGNSHFGDRTSLGSGAHCSGNCTGDYMNSFSITTWSCDDCGDRPDLEGRTLSNADAQELFNNRQAARVPEERHSGFVGTAIATADCNDSAACFNVGFSLAEGRAAAETQDSTAPQFENWQILLPFTMLFTLEDHYTGKLPHDLQAPVQAASMVVGPSKINAAAKTIRDAPRWIWSSSKGVIKTLRQMNQRGWTPQQITEAMQTGAKVAAPNNVNPANTATRYMHPETGRSVVVDDVTQEVLHVGGDGFRY